MQRIAKPLEPFPLDLLAAISRPQPGRPGWGYELLPFLRWLNGHLAWRSVAIVEDGRGLWVPVLEKAAAETPDTACIRVNQADIETWAPGPLDCVHMTAECPAERLTPLVATVCAHVADGGLVLLQTPSASVRHDGAIRLPIGDGLTLLQPYGAPNAVMAWLRRRNAAELQAFGRLFDGLGAGADARLDLAGMRARSEQASAREANDAQLRQRLDHLQQNDRQLRGVIEQLSNERDAVYASASWRATSPLRRMSARRAGAPAPPASAPTLLPSRNPLAEFLAGSGRLTLPSASRPAVTAPALTILVTVEDQPAPLFACLDALIASGIGTEAEVVIVANGCAAEVRRLLDRVDGARILTTERGEAAEAFAAGLSVANGAFILLLDCRVRLRPGAVAAAVATLRATPWAGAVCGKVFSTAGAIIQAGEWVDAAGLVHGRGAGLPVMAPEVQYRGPVPSGTAMFLLVRSRLLRQMGGLSPAFAGTSHAGADLCLRLRGAGWQTVYEPMAEVLADAAPGPQAEAVLFAARHARPVSNAINRPGPAFREQRRLLMIDDRVPYPALGAGYPRAARMVHELHRLGWQITYFPNDAPYDDWSSVYRQFPREVEFMLGYGRAALGHLLHTRSGAYDTVVVSRPHNMRDYLAARHAAAPPRRLVYDAEAVFVTREFLRLEQAGRSPDPAQRRAMLDEEIGLTASADIVTAVNPAEAEIFRAAGSRAVAVLGLGSEPAPIGKGLAQRHDFLFVGAIGEDNAPNADAVAWFVTEIMPLLDRRIGPGYRLLVAGRCRAPKILALASERVHVVGLVDDLAPLYAAARAFVAPTRYAAGLPLKVQEAVGRGLPVVGTALLAEQLGWTAGREMLVASTAEEFAACCARLYTDPALWYALRRQGLDRLGQETRQSDFAATVKAIFGQGWVT